MKLLLDTQLLLWAAADSDRLPNRLRTMLQDTGNALAFSAASIWEVVIKRSLGRSDFAVDPFLLRRGLLDNDYDELPVTGDHVIALSRLPTLHKDPFDRILLAQCMVEGMVLLTSDGLVATYPRPEQKI